MAKTKKTETKKEVKEAVEKVVEEAKAEDIPVEVVKEEASKHEGKKLFVHEGGQLGYLDDEGNFRIAK